VREIASTPILSIVPVRKRKELPEEIAALQHPDPVIVRMGDFETNG
jgi:hypothetical protein